MKGRYTQNRKEMGILSSNYRMIQKVVLVICSTVIILMAAIIKPGSSCWSLLVLCEQLQSISISWVLRPPYLYLLLNSIIITIVASAKLQSSSKVITIDSQDHYHHPSSNMEVLPALVDPIDMEEAYRVSKTGHDDGENKGKERAVYGRGGGGCANLHLGNTYGSLLPPSEATSCHNTNMGSKEEEVHYSPYSITANDHTDLKLHHLTTTAAAAKDATNDFISLSKNNTDPALFFRPPVSARFTHRKLIKTPTPIQGGKTLRVAKPTRNETLESTWKTITDGRPMPLKRHLRKSDTWETHGGRHGHDHEDMQYNKMNKYRTFNDRSRINSSGSGKLRKDPSLSQDDLNKRVESFINKFNEGMRLQRQESLNQYMEMINRGAH